MHAGIGFIDIPAMEAEKTATAAELRGVKVRRTSGNRGCVGQFAARILESGTPSGMR